VRLRLSHGVRQLLIFCSLCDFGVDISLKSYVNLQCRCGVRPNGQNTDKDMRYEQVFALGFISIK
jgi:hypothetical protein